MNTEFPTELVLRGEPEGTVLKLNRQRARVSEKEIAFSVPTSRSRRYRGTLRFAVDTSTMCKPIVLPLSFTVGGG
jgi:hypothetical protein